MRSMFPFDTALQPAPSYTVQSRCARVALLALAACTSDEVSLGGGDDPSGGSGACVLGVGGVVEGDVMASSQEEVDGLAGCREITGSLNITASPWFDLSPLASLRHVGGWLDIDGPVESLQGLEGLERVGELHLTGLDVTSLEPLHNLTEVSYDPLANSWGFSTVYVADCARLIDLTGLENLVVWDEFHVIRLPSLESLRGLVMNRENQRLYVMQAPNLRDITGLRVGALLESIRLVNTGIESFDSGVPFRLRRLELTNNPALVSVEGLQAIQSVEELVIRNNDRLEQLPELPYLGVDLAILSIQDNDSLRSIPQWVDPDDGDFLPPENLGEPGAGDYFFPPEFSMAEITDNAQLSELAFPSTFRFGGNVRIHDNPQLKTIDLGFLDSADDVSIVNNPVLAEIEIPVLETVDALHVVDNPSLPPSVFDNVRSFSTEMQGNLDAAAP
jgi:hypothetical protein